MKTFKKHLPSTEQHGFALISTLSIMALLVMLAIGMMSLATTESKVADATKYEMEAKANARMALMIALGELQEEVGPDQRITGNASIFANDSGGNDPSRASFDATSIDSNFENPHLLGVWDSWKTWLSGDNDPSEIAATYDRGRTQNFRRYLVSHPDSENLSPQQWRSIAEGGYGGIETVDLVNKVLGDDPNDSDIVKAPIVETPNGGYAWHVSGNNQKANVSLGKEDRDTEVAGSAAELANLTSHGLDGSIDSSLDNYPVEAEDTEKALSLQTSTLVDSNATDFLKTHYQENYHAYTADSQSILADVRKGGLKKDLNAYLELDLNTSMSGGGDLRSQFGINAVADSDYPKAIREIDGYLGNPQHTFSSGGGAGQPNLPSWYRLHQYYQAYKGGQGSLDEMAASQLEGAAPLKEGLAYESKRPSISFNVATGNMMQRGYTRAPVVSRMFLQMGVRRSEQGGSGGLDEFLWLINPVLVLWNPYNTTMEVPQLRGRIRMADSLEFKITQGSGNNVSRNNDDPALATSPWRDFDYEFDIATNGSGNIILAPGETRIFSTQEGDLPTAGEVLSGVRNLPGENRRKRWIILSEGYEPEYTGSIRRMALQQWAWMSDYVPDQPAEVHIRLTGDEYRANETYTFTWGIHTSDSVPGSRERRYSEMGWRPLPKPSTSPLPDGDKTESVALTIPTGRPFPPSAVQTWNDTRAQFFLQIGFALKNSDWNLDPQDLAGFHPDSGKDYRCKNYLFANPANMRSQVLLDTDRQLGMGQYEFFTKRSGGALSVAFNEQTNRAASFTTNEPGGHEQVALTEMPISPAYSLAALQNFRLQSGGRIWDAPGQGAGSGFHLFEASASNFALGIGNSYALPMIDQDDIYYNAFDGKPDAADFPSALGARKKNEDVWDHLLIQNDALYDEWFTSTLTQQSTSNFANSRELPIVFDAFAAGTESLPNQHFVFDAGTQDTATVKSELINGSDFNSNAFEKVSKYLLLNGGFNVNSTSVESWKGLFHGLRTESIQYLPQAANARITTTSLVDASNPNGQVVLSRFSFPNTVGEGSDADDSESWTGVRYLTDIQIDKLAEECVRQVKLRGPFLNMSDFVNRRLDPNDTETSRAGALQAAIDWDEYNGNNPVNNNESINGRFKQAGDMITAANSTGTWGGGAGGTLPFSEAYYGSRWSGIPGYVMQGDLLKRIGNQITVRDDTFTIRAYGESKDAQGKVKAKAVCEAVVQRTPRYVNHKDTGNPGADGATPETQFDDIATNDDTNRRYGRKMVIKSFRWLSDKEI